MPSNQTSPILCIGLTVHPQPNRAAHALSILQSACKLRKIEIFRIDESKNPPRKNPYQIVVSVGGDGTLLAGARIAYPDNVPVWGINVGHLGFLTTSGTDEIEAGVERLSKGEFSVENRAMLHGSVLNGSGESMEIVALNDIVIHRKSTSGIAVLDAELDGRYLASYEVDGLIIATPTGSTAYSLSAGGSILSPEISAFMITPICAHSLSARPLVVSDTSRVVLKPRFDDPDQVLLVQVDGQVSVRLTGKNIEQDVHGGVSMEIGKADRDAKLVRFDDVVFSDVLRDKLGWAGGAPFGKTR